MWIFVGIIVLLVGSALFWTIVEMKKRGVFRSKRRELDLALVGLSQQIRRDPANVKAYTRRGLIRAKKGDRKGAEADLTRAIELDDENVEARYHRGILRQQDRNNKGAEEDFRWIRAHSEDPFYKTAVSERLDRMRR